VVTKSSEDFRDWDIEPETSSNGTDARGYPYFLWRESADNRLTLSRPRYCCITEKPDGLYFTFFDPSKDQRPTGAMRAFWYGAALVMVIVVLASCMQSGSPRGPYVSDMSAPPGLVLVAAFLYATSLGALASGIWYAVVIVRRWMSGRFPGEGRISMMPWTSLRSFERISASDAGVIVNDKPASTGYCLAAVFDDNSQLILNRTAWNFDSIQKDHRLLTRIFIDERGRYTTGTPTPQASPQKSVQATAQTPPAPVTNIPKSIWD
jgi:hypothetical protein